MRYLDRKIDSFLEEWYQNKDKYPLIIKGPHHVGKAESVLHFALKHYNQIININFVEEPIYKRIVDNGYSVKKIIKMITLIDNSKQFVENDTLIFFDEIQAFPNIATSLKFLN